jgi:Organic solute transporter Ostalpha
VAGLFVLGAVPISVYGVQAHLEQYVHPRLQKHIVRILWMPCVYGLDAWLALRFKDSSVVFDALRECYEAFVIYHFFVFLIVFLEQVCGGASALALEGVARRGVRKA